MIGIGIIHVVCELNGVERCRQGHVLNPRVNNKY